MIFPFLYILVIGFTCALNSSDYNGKRNAAMNLDQYGMRNSTGRFQAETINMLPNVGWYSFTFKNGNSGQYAFQTFYFVLPVLAGLRITDCYCGGDSFAVFTDREALTQIISVDTQSCQVANESCNFFNDDPNECFNTLGWCSGTSNTLSPGFYNISIMIATSPFLMGTGFLALDTMCIDPMNNSAYTRCCQLSNNCNDSIYQ